MVCNTRNLPALSCIGRSILNLELGTNECEALTKDNDNGRNQVIDVQCGFTHITQKGNYLLWVNTCETLVTKLERESLLSTSNL